MVLMALIVAPMMELMALNVVKHYNEYELKKASKEKREPVLIHQFSSHVMRHTGCTNMARSGVRTLKQHNILCDMPKVILL